MKNLPLIGLTLCIAGPLSAEDTRQLDAHEHGTGQLDIAIEGQQISMELHAPGADIVGFEYKAQSAEDRAAIDAAVATLAQPLSLFVIPDDAACSVVQATAELEGDHEGHDDHDDHDEHDDHAEHDDHEEHDDHAEHEADASHAEFHASYRLECADPSAASMIEFAYFDAFPYALELEVQVITDAGANAFEVTRDAPELDLAGMF